MWQNTLEWFNFEFSCNFLNLSSDHLICVLWFDSSSCSKESVPSSQYDIGLFTLWFSTDNNSVTTFCWETVNMGSYLNLNQIFVFQRNWVFLKWWEMTAHLIDWNATWKGNTSFKFLGFLATENFSKFFLNECINCLANGVNISTSNTLINCHL